MSFSDSTSIDYGSSPSSTRSSMTLYDRELSFWNNDNQADTPARSPTPLPFIVNMPSLRMSSAKHWAFRWSNYPANASETLVASFEGFIGCDAWCFQHEIGAGQVLADMTFVPGTPHIQGCVKFNRRVRWSQLELPDAIHWEACKGSWQQNVNYCSKEATRDATKGGTVFHSCRADTVVDVIALEAFYPWQRKIYDILCGPVDARAIYWIWENVGNVGKSSFVKHMVVKHHAIFCAGSRTSDIVNLVYNAFSAGKPIDTILWDLPRNAQGRVSFNAIEMLKNGLIANMKYETGVAAFNPPHIVIFANHPPISFDDISLDRWRLHQIVGNDIDFGVFGV